MTPYEAEWDGPGVGDCPPRAELPRPWIKDDLALVKRSKGAQSWRYGMQVGNGLTLASLFPEGGDGAGDVHLAAAHAEHPFRVSAGMSM